jgi:hypothetical protein
LKQGLKISEEYILPMQRGINVEQSISLRLSGFARYCFYICFQWNFASETDKLLSLN